MSKIYLASSWRNAQQSEIVQETIDEPELMYLLGAQLVSSITELHDALMKSTNLVDIEAGP